MEQEFILPPGAAPLSDSGAASQAVAGGEQSPTSLANGVPPADPGQPQFDLLSELNTRFGSGFQSADEIRSAIENSRLVEEYRQKSEQSQFANPLAQRFNDLAKNGATLLELSRFVQMQEMNIAAISDEEVVRIGISRQFPNFTAEEVQAYVEHSLGISGYGSGDQLAPLASANLKVKAVEYRQQLEAQKVASETPQSFEVQRAATATAEALRLEWSTEMSKISQTTKSHRISLSEVVPGLGEYTLDYIPSPEAVEKARQQVAEHFAGTGSGVAVNRQQAQDVFRATVLVHDQERLMKALAQDVYASARQQLAAEMAGPLPNRSTHAGATAGARVGISHPAELLK